MLSCWASSHTAALIVSPAFQNILSVTFNGHYNHDHHQTYLEEITLGVPTITSKYQIYVSTQLTNYFYTYMSKGSIKKNKNSLFKIKYLVDLFLD